MYKKCINAEKQRLLFFMKMLIVGAVLIIVYSCFTGNTNQFFSDIVNEYTAKEGSNKSAERLLFYIFSIGGAAAYFCYCFLKKPAKEHDDLKRINKNRYIIVGLLVLGGGSLFIWTNTNWLVIAALILAFAVHRIDDDLLLVAVAFLFICSYAVCALYRLYAFCGGNLPISLTKVSLISFLIAVGILYRFKSVKAYLKGIMVCQVFIPLSMLIFLSSTYKTDNYENIKICVPNKVLIFICFIVVIFVLEALYKARKKWSHAEDLNDILAFGTCVSIMSFNSYAGEGAVISSDMHHPFENIIGYNQTFELGQRPFSQYIPVSGMYSFLHGFFVSFWGNDQVAFFAVATNIYFLSVIMLIVFLLKKQLKSEWTLFISFVFMLGNDWSWVPSYNRHLFIVPILLLLAWPKLIDRKNLWLKAWFLTSFLHGLYYPVFGAAVCISFFPLGIYQIYSYARSKELLRDLRTKRFWIWWALCLVPVICGSKLLLGTYRHIKAMNGQTVFADGTTRFGQEPPSRFLSLFTPVMPLRTVLYYLFSYLIIICIIWVSAALFMKIGNVHFIDKKIKIENPTEAYLSLSIALLVLVAISYTVIRLDHYYLYARSENIVRACFVLLIVIVGRYLNKSHSNTLWVFFFACFIISANNSEGFLAINSYSKLNAFYTAPSGYVHVVNDRVNKLGECFVSDYAYDYIESKYESLENIDKSKSYLGISDNYGLFYLNEIKGDSVLEPMTIRGYSATQETVDIIKRNSTIVGDCIDPVDNYYLYHWLVTSGEYIWDPVRSMFIPNDGTMPKEDILEKNKKIELSFEDASLGRTAGSWGSSIDSLKKIFTRYDINYKIVSDVSQTVVDFGQQVNGKDADFMYIEFADMTENFEYIQLRNYDFKQINTEKMGLAKALLKKDYNTGMDVIVTWTDESGVKHSMSCSMDEGKLLIPLGGGQGWLLNDHTNVVITVLQDGQSVAVPDIVDFKLLKVREVN